MKTFVIKKEHLNDKNEYIGPDLSDFNGNIESEKDLGIVKLSSIRASGHIIFDAKSGIDAAWGIKAGDGIEAGLGIKAGDGIEAGLGIKAGSTSTG